MSRVIRPKFIYRWQLRENPMWLYAFGDNMSRIGLGGQAKEMRGEPNSIGVPTKWTPFRTDRSYFTDDILDPTHPPGGPTQVSRFSRNQMVIDAIDEAFSKLRNHLAADGIVVIPADGLGTGLAQLPTRAPRIHRYIEDWISRLEEVAQ